MSENMRDFEADMDWTGSEYLAVATAEELSKALIASGIRFIGCGYSDDADREISVAFDGIEAAGQAVVLGIPVEETLGGFYDRATASCLTLTEITGRDETAPDSEVEAAIGNGWLWTVHPASLNGRMGWHVSVDMPMADAATLTANLNAARLAGERS